MPNLDDIARIGYVLDNFDEAKPILKSDGTPETSLEFRGRDNNPAPMIRFTKKINGSFYVIEAIADNSYKKLWVVSAYINKDETVTQVLDADKTAPSSKSSETPLASPVSVFNNSIPQSAENINTQTAKTGTLGRAAVPTIEIRYGEVPGARAAQDAAQGIAGQKNSSADGGASEGWQGDDDTTPLQRENAGKYAGGNGRRARGD